MKLDHTLVPAADKEASAKFFARVMGLEYLGIQGTAGLVKVDEQLTLRFEERQTGRVHLAFHVTEEEFDAVLGRLLEEGAGYGTMGSRSQPFDMQVGEYMGGRRIYFDDVNGQNFEIMTVAS